MLYGLGGRDDCTWVVEACGGMWDHACLHIPCEGPQTALNCSKAAPNVDDDVAYTI